MLPEWVLMDADWTRALHRWTIRTSVILRFRFMWVSKPIYEGLPYFYLVAGSVTLAASMYLNHWYWPTICFAVGLLCLVGGLVVLLRRRDYRQSDRRTARAVKPASR